MLTVLLSFCITDWYSAVGMFLRRGRNFLLPQQNRNCFPSPRIIESGTITAIERGRESLDALIAGRQKEPFGVSMFHWLSDHRRKKLTEAPFPPAWEEIVRRNVVHYCMLDAAERIHLRALIQVFIAEKTWEGCGGLELTDEIRVTISAQACLLLLGLPHDYYRNVLSIIVYPSTVVPPQRKIGHFEIPLAPIEMRPPHHRTGLPARACHPHLGRRPARQPPPGTGP